MILTISNLSLPLPKSLATSTSKFIYCIEIANRLFDNTLNEMNIFSFTAKYKENETCTCKSILK